MLQEKFNMKFELKSIQLENFKCFKKTNEIVFNKLTLITGANSSGKSSIIQALVGALQSNAFPFLFSTNGKYINMGDFSDISHNHNKKGEVFLNFVLHNKNEEINLNVRTGWKQNRQTKLPHLNSLSAECEFFTLSLKRISGNYLLDYDYYPEKDPSAKVENQMAFQSFLTLMLDNSAAKKKKPTGELDAKQMTQEHFSEHHIKNKKLPIQANGMAKVTNTPLFHRFKFLIDAFNELDQKTNLISSFRLHPNRTHLENSQDFLKIKKFGEGYLDQIIRWENGNKKKLNELITHLKKLSLLYSIRTNRIGGGRYDTIVTTNPKGTEVSLSDVGFGISQFLPILVADLQMGDNSSLIIAQPEIHLHPNVQADFGDYLASQIEKNKKNYIIETHSEYLLNRIRLLIVKDNTIKEPDLAIYYIENIKGESKIHELKFGKKGQIIGAPKGFFKTYMMDVMDIALNV